MSSGVSHFAWNFEQWLIDPVRALMGVKPMVYQSINNRDSAVYCFLPHYLQWTFSLEMAETFFLKKFMMEISAKQQKFFQDEIKITNKDEKERKTVVNWRFVELSEDDKQINKPKL